MIISRTYRIDLHSREPLQFSVVRLNAKGRDTGVLTYRPTLEQAVADAQFFGNHVIVSPGAARAEMERRAQA